MRPDDRMNKRSAQSRTSGQSLIGLNSINFFQAEMVGVVLPMIGVFLKEHGWRYDSIGIATAAVGLGTLLFQAPAGMITDRISSRRFLFAAAAVTTGIGLTLIPLLPSTKWTVDTLLFISGAAQSFFPPLLGALALALVGHELLNRTAGTNQGWSHAGNIAAAIGAVAGPVASGILVEHLGFKKTFVAFSLLALAGATLFTTLVPETKSSRESKEGQAAA
jgi:MFS family permease